MFTHDWYDHSAPRLLELLSDGEARGLHCACGNRSWSQPVLRVC